MRRFYSFPLAHHKASPSAQVPTNMGRVAGRDGSCHQAALHYSSSVASPIRDMMRGMGSARILRLLLSQLR